MEERQEKGRHNRLWAPLLPLVLCIVAFLLPDIIGLVIPFYRRVSEPREVKQIFQGRPAGKKGWDVSSGLPDSTATPPLPPPPAYQVPGWGCRSEAEMKHPLETHHTTRRKQEAGPQLSAFFVFLCLGGFLQVSRLRPWSYNPQSSFSSLVPSLSVSPSLSLDF